MAYSGPDICFKTYNHRHPHGCTQPAASLISVTGNRALVVSAEPLGDAMAGPAIRVRAIESVLIAAGHRVVAADLTTAPAVDLSMIDVAVVQGASLGGLPELAGSDIPIVVDLYDPFHLEALHRGAHDMVRRLDLLEGSLGTLADQIARGDFFLCASRTQRHLWLGHLASAGRLNPATHAQDASFHRLISLAPFGVDDMPFMPEGRIVDHVPAATGSPILLWAGGIHDWLDPLTVIEAMPKIRTSFPTAQLVLLGGRHPNGALEPMAMVGKAKHLATDLGLLGTGVIVHEQWVANADRADLLGGADLGVLAQHDHAETEFAFRTRLLDHLWAGLPTVSTMGDELSRELAVHGAARIVPPGDAEAFADACVAVLGDDLNQRTRELTRQRAAHHGWTEALAPLVAFVDSPQMAPDRADPACARLIRDLGATSHRDQTTVIARAQRHLDVGGAKQLAEKSVDAAKHRIAGFRGR